MSKKSETPESANVITEDDLAEIRKFILRTNIDTISDDMRKVVEEYMPELTHKLPSREEQQAERPEPMPPEQRQMHRWKDRLVPYTVSGRQRKKGGKQPE